MNTLLCFMFIAFSDFVLSDVLSQRDTPACGKTFTNKRERISIIAQPGICHWMIDVDASIYLHLKVQVAFPPRDCSFCSDGYFEYGTFDYRNRKVIENSVCANETIDILLNRNNIWFSSILAGNLTNSSFWVEYESIASHHLKNTLVVGICFGVVFPFVFIGPGIYYCREKKKRNPSYIRKKELREIHRIKMRTMKSMKTKVEKQLEDMQRNPPTFAPFGKDATSPNSDNSDNSTRSDATSYIHSHHDNRHHDNRHHGYKGNSCEKGYEFDGLNLPNRPMILEFFKSLHPVLPPNASSTNNLFGQLSTNDLYVPSAERRVVDATYLDINISRKRKLSEGFDPCFEPTKYEDMGDTYSKLPTPNVEIPKRQDPIYLREKQDPISFLEKQDPIYLDLRNQTPLLPPPPKTDRISRRNSVFVVGRSPTWWNVPVNTGIKSNSSPSIYGSTPAFISAYNMTPITAGFTAGFTTPSSVQTLDVHFLQNSVFSYQGPLSQSTPDILMSAPVAPVIKVNDVTLKDLFVQKSNSANDFTCVTMTPN